MGSFIRRIYLTDYLTYEPDIFGEDYQQLNFKVKLVPLDELPEFMILQEIESRTALLISTKEEEDINPYELGFEAFITINDLIA